MPIPATWSARLLSVMRIVVALVFFSHGISQFFGLPPFPMPLTPLLTVAGALEVVGGAAAGAENLDAGGGCARVCGAYHALVFGWGGGGLARFCGGGDEEGER